MLSNLITTLSVVTLSVCFVGSWGEFIVTHSPGHVTFTDSASSLKIGDIQNVVTQLFGLEVGEDFSWDGVGSVDLFKRPRANVLFSVEGAPPLMDLNIANVARFNTEADVPRVETENVVNPIQSASDERPMIVDFSIDSTVFEVKSHRPEMFRNVPATHDKLQRIFSSAEMPFSAAEMGALNTTQSEDLYFLGELLIIREILSAVRTSPKTFSQTPSFFHFKIRGLAALGRRYGDTSAQVRAAVALLESFLGEMTAAVRAHYRDNALVEVVTVPREEEVKVRHARQAPAAPAPAAAATPTQQPAADLNLAAPYDNLYPVMFNITLWLFVVLTLTVTAISYGIWFMDPGRDSIIYRMTSQRIKKD